MTPSLRSLTSGRSVILNEKIASSGEGTVWKTNCSGVLAKLYHKPTQDRIDKLKVMVAHPPQNPMRQHHHVTFAWPQDLLQDERGQCLGFLMPEITDSVKLSLVYNPKLRNRKAPRFNWYYLHTAALNFALSLKALHEEGYVVGDIKPQNLLVNNRALISVIDTDSFQVRDPNTQAVYRCLVGSEGFTPPELLGQELSNLNQLETHDRFRLGVMIHLLLFGDQPFKGKWIGAGESPQPTELIRQGFWPYAPNSKVQAGPNTIPLSIIHPQLQVCFQRCFTEGHRNPQARPSAQDWSEALKLAIADLSMCGVENNHYHSRLYGHCYWCDRRTATGIDIFSPKPVVHRKPPASKRSTRSPGGGMARSAQAKVASMTAMRATQGMTYLNPLPLKGTGLPGSQGTGALFANRWSHPVVWGMGFILFGLGGLALLLLPELNFEALQKSGTGVGSTLEQQLRPLLGNNTQTKLDTALTATKGTQSATLRHGGHWDAVTTLDISSDDKLLVSGSKDMTVKLWKLPSGQLQHTFSDHYEPVVSVAFSDQKPALVTSSLSGKVLIWDPFTATLLRGASTSIDWELEGTIRTSATDSRGQLVASSGWGGLIVLQDLKSGKVTRIPSNSFASEQALAVLPNGKTVVSSSSDGRFEFWDSNTGALTKTLAPTLTDKPIEPVNALTISRDGQLLASGGWYGTIALWNLTTGTLIKNLRQEEKAISAIAISDRKDLIATVSNDMLIKLWNVETGEVQSILKGHSAAISALKFSHNGKFLVSGGNEPSIKIWDLATLKVLKTLVQ